MKTKDIIKEILPLTNMAEIAKSYYKKDKTWLNHKLNERIINGVKYSLNNEEIKILSNALKDISSKLLSTAKKLDAQHQSNIKQRGIYYTEGNPFKYQAFREWYDLIPKETPIIEPFAGACNIPKLIQQAGFKADWKCYDIAPKKMDEYHVTKRDTISKFPTAKIVITNPPFLAKNSAKRKGIPYPDTDFNNLYKSCLNLILKNSDYVAVILPDSFITAPELKDRLRTIITINEKIFSDTNYPVCLALFTPKKTDDFNINIGDTFIGSFNKLQETIKKAENYKWIFNSPNGNIGVICIDSLKPNIKFIKGEEIEESDIKVSSRAFTRIEGLPDNINREEFIEKCNETLNQYRIETQDVLMTSYKGLRKDGKYRKRISFNEIRRIMNYVLSSYKE